MRLRTWHCESATVAAALGGVVVATHGGWIEWLGAFAVFCGFSHASITERMREREAARPVPSVECYRKSLWYFLAKEVAWVAFFIANRSWSALVGCFLFLAYPIWRRFWRSCHPMQQAQGG